jgi:hypothetical protein
MDAMIKVGQEQMTSEIKIGLEEIMATESEAIVGHYEGVPRAEATRILTILQVCCFE